MVVKALLFALHDKDKSFFVKKRNKPLVLGRQELLNGLRRYDLNLSKQDVAEMPLFVGAISGPLFWSLVSKKMLIQSEKYFTIFNENV